jgi:hypothetical protein
VIEDPRTRFRRYIASAAKMHPRTRAAWWRDTIKRDPEVLALFRGDGKAETGKRRK